MKVVWRARAQAELAAIVERISRDDASAAIRLRDQVLHSVSFLADWPEMGRRGKRNLRELVIAHTAYLVLYRVTPGKVTIVRVLHGMRRR